MRRRFLAPGVAAVAVAVSSQAGLAAGLYIGGRDVVEANGEKFVMRGVNHPHVWYESRTDS